MDKYICDKCGYILEIDKIENAIYGRACPICKGTLLSEEETKKREEIAKLLDEDNNNDNMTPKEDAEEDTAIFMTNAIYTHGNDATWLSIEEIGDPEVRIFNRKIFLHVGGLVPKGKTIKI